MSDQAQRPDVRIVVGHVSALAKLFLFAATTGAAVVTARAVGVDHIGAFGVEAPLDYIWVLFFAVTIAHYHLSIATVRGFEEVLENEHSRGTPDDALTGEVIYQEIRAQNTVFLRGLLARSPISGGRLYRMSWHDPTTLVFVGLCVLDFAALLPWRNVRGNLIWTTDARGVVFQTILAVVLLTINWISGSAWTIALSQLRLPLNESTVLSRHVNYSTPAGNEMGCLLLVVVAVLAIAFIPWLLVTLF